MIVFIRNFITKPVVWNVIERLSLKWGVFVWTAIIWSSNSQFDVSRVVRKISGAEIGRASLQAISRLAYYTYAYASDPTRACPLLEAGDFKDTGDSCSSLMHYAGIQPRIASLILALAIVFKFTVTILWALPKTSNRKKN